MYMEEEILRSDLPEKFSSIISLGEPVKVFPQNTSRIVLAFFFLILGIAIFIWFIWILGAACLLMFLYFLWLVISKWGESAVLYQNGFAYYDGEEVQPIAWGEIETILSETTQVLMYGIIPTSKWHYFFLWTTSGKRFKMGYII